jgi:DnaJ-domain-containing protein 1
MELTSALRRAIDLKHFPSQAERLRSAPLPDDVLILLRIVAGEEEAMSEAVQLANRSPEMIREAAAFFVEQILLYPGADSYRVLGAKPDASYTELRRNMALLLRRLHPDRDGQADPSVYVARVTGAWSDLKTPERRAAYDKQRFRPSAASVHPDKGRKSALSSGRKRQARSFTRRGHGRHPVSPPMPFAHEVGHGFLRWLVWRLFGRAAL